MDSAGNVYVAGDSKGASSFYDYATAKYDPAGKALWTVYRDWGANDDARFLALDAEGNAYVTGSTASTEATFPVTIGPDLTHNGDYDAFVAKVNSSGTALVYCGYIG